MTGAPEDVVARLVGADEARPLPPELRARLERTLTATDPVARAVAAADGARPIPPDARGALEEMLLAGAAAAMPPGVRRRLIRRLGPDRRLTAVAAAVVLLVLLSVATLLRPTSSTRVPSADGRPPRATSTTLDGLGGRFAADSLGEGASPAGPVASDRAPGAAASGAAGGFAAAGLSADGRPPFTYDYPYGGSASFSAADGAAPGPVPAKPPPGPIRIGVAPGDADQEGGFRAYIDLLNSRGGAGGHRIDVVEAGPQRSPTGTIATVNLARGAVAEPGAKPGWTAPVLLETLTVAEGALRGDVFSMASPLERQGRLAVAAAFPTAVSGQTAAVYRPAVGTYAVRVAPVVRAALEARGVTVFDLQYEPGQGVPLVVADAAFVILDIEETKAWLAQAKAQGYSPGRRIWALAPGADDSWAPDMPTATSVMSPYAFMDGSEARALRQAVGPLNARRIHGWQTAKWLAYAIWRSDATTSAQLSTALQATKDWSSGWAPPYETRPGTRSRTPEAVRLDWEGGRLVTKGEFLADR